MDNTTQLPYKYVFDKDELTAIKACTNAHGFAIVKKVLTLQQVERLKNSIKEVFRPALQGDQVVLNPDILDKLANTEQTTGEPSFPEVTTYTMLDFIEKSEEAASLMVYEPYMKIVRSLYEHQPITLNRSAAIYKKPGAAAGGWHTDWEPQEGVYGANAVLNNTGACSNWFYLTGLSPDNGGLSLIADSHTEDWRGPEGFELTENRRSFRPKGSSLNGYSQFDFPEALRLYAEPGDLVIFAERTFHGVFPHHGDELRLSLAINFRPGTSGFPKCWPLSESSKKFIASCPAEAQPMVKYYTGHSLSWRSEQ